MSRIESECSFVIENRFAEVPKPVIGVPQVVEQVCVPLPGLDQAFVSIGGFLELALAVGLVCFCENALVGCQQKAGKANHYCGNEYPKRFLHGRKWSINSRTSFRVSAGSRRTP